MLRPATRTDLPFVSDLQARSEFRAMIVADGPERLASYIDDPLFDLLIWVDADAPAGFALLKLSSSPSNHIEFIRICIDAPGRGDGQRIIAELITHSVETLQAHRIWLDVAADNTRARKAYACAGFQHEDTLRQHWRRRTGDFADLALYGLSRADWAAI